jgi:TolB-like protein
MLSFALLSCLVAASGVDTRPQILVMPIEHDEGNSPTTVAVTVSEAIGAEIAKEPGFSVLTHADLSRLAALEGEKQAMGCETDQSCLADIATALGARFVVSGRLTKVDENQVLQTTLLDAHGGRALARESISEPTITRLLGRIPELVTILIDAASMTMGAEGVVVVRRARTVEEPFPFMSTGLIMLGAGAVVFVAASVTTLAGGALLLTKGIPIEVRDSYWLFLAAGGVGLVLATAVVVTGGATAGAAFFIE